MLVPLQDMGRYPTVVIDPPWPLRLAARYEQRRSGGFPAHSLRYKSLPLHEIAALPIQEVLADDAFLFCWTVNQFLFDVPMLFHAWGVTRRFVMGWHKSNGMQSPNGPKYNGEFIVVGTKGRPRFLETKAFWTFNYWPRGAHSEKPEDFYETLRRITARPRLDIYARREIDEFGQLGRRGPTARR